MKITVGKSYEGTSGFSRIKDGTYVFQIIEIKQTKGRVDLTMVNSQKQLCFKTFWLLDKQGKTSDRGMRELADFITTALQIDDEETEVEIGDALGCYLQAEVKNGSYENAEGLTKSVQYVNRPKRANGFTDGTGSLLEEMQSRRKAKREREQASEVEQEEQDDDSDDTNDSLNFLDSLGI